MIELTSKHITDYINHLRKTNPDNDAIVADFEAFAREEKIDLNTCTDYQFTLTRYYERDVSENTLPYLQLLGAMNRIMLRARANNGDLTNGGQGSVENESMVIE